jgi:hypothetical protein
MQMKNIIRVLIILTVSVVPLFSQDTIHVLPRPQQITLRDGHVTISAATRIVLHAAQDRLAADMLNQEIERAIGRKLVITRGRAPLASTIYLTRLGDPAAKVTPGSKLGDEGYVIHIAANKIVVAGKDNAGLFYGVQTLRQLLRPAGKRMQVPNLEIEDWPAMKIRGVHVDVSRGPVPTLDYMKEQIRTLAEYKINLYSLYMENVFAFQKNPLVAPDGGALTPTDIRELVDYARQYHVTVMPEQQTFGHLHHVLKYEIYNEIAERPHGHVLTPTNEKSYALIQDMYGELVPLFPGPYIHIGGDETFELGQGRTKALAGQAGLGRVYLDHIQRVAQILKPYNKRLMFWGDIALKYPESLNILPKDMIAVVWNYDPLPSFEDQIKPFRSAGMDVVVAPGANNWSRPWPDLDSAFVNIENMVRDGKKLGAIGMLNTDWRDDGAALFGMTWPAMVFGASCAWQESECTVQQFDADYDWAFYRNPDTTFARAIHDLSHTHTLLRQVKLDGAYNADFWLNPFSVAGTVYTARVLPVVSELRLDAEHAALAVMQNKDRAVIHRNTLAYMKFGAMQMDSLGLKVQLANEIANFYCDAYQNQSERSRARDDLAEITDINGRMEDLRNNAVALRDVYSDLWSLENRPYWKGNVLVRYDNLGSLYQQKVQEMGLVLDQFDAHSPIPPPQQFGFTDATGQCPAPLAH